MKYQPHKYVHKSLGSPLIPSNKNFPSTPPRDYSWKDFSKNAQNQFWSTLGRHFVRNRHGALLHTSARAVGRLTPHTYSEYMENNSIGGTRKRYKKHTRSIRSTRPRSRRTTVKRSKKSKRITKVSKRRKRKH